MELFKNRRDAGQRLANLLQKYVVLNNTYLLALPRGGVPVAYEIAIRLKLPLDILGVKKLVYPADPEYAIGAVASDGLCIINPRMRELISQDLLAQMISRVEQELDTMVGLNIITTQRRQTEALNEVVWNN